jgi:hypothetical protein
MSAEVGYFVFVEAKPIKKPGRSFRYNTTVTIIDPPTDPDELKTVIWLKVADKNPDHNITVLSFAQFADEEPRLPWDPYN